VSRLGWGHEEQCSILPGAFGVGREGDEERLGKMSLRV
jgi:hypothetical protein